MKHAEICETIQRGMGSLFECAAFEGYYRIRTPYLYPDGDTIDLYCIPRDDIITVTDLADATGWLWMQTAALRRTARQNRLIQETCRTHNIEFYRGTLQARCKPGDDLADVVNRVAQAAIRVSDLYFTMRHAGASASQKTITPVTKDVAEYLTAHNFTYESDKKLIGRSERVWNVDFQVSAPARLRAPARSSLVYVMSARNRSAANRLTEHVVAAWHDLQNLSAGANPPRFVSLFDDASEIWREEDIRQVKDLSIVARWSRQEQFVKTLREAA